jgi:hypothetical protein
LKKEKIVQNLSGWELKYSESPLALARVEHDHWHDFPVECKIVLKYILLKYSIGTEFATFRFKTMDKNTVTKNHKLGMGRT